MPYQIRRSRNNIATSILSDTAGFNEQQLNGLSNLLKINTSLPNADFLREFRQLKTDHPIINYLCQPNTGGLFWRKGISYFFKTETQRAERYKTIVHQLKQGATTEHISYFGNNRQNKNSVCNKIETIKNEYLTKSYPNENNDNFKKDNRTYLELCNFQNNVDYKKPIQVLPATIQNLDSTSKDIFTEFVKINPQYSSITSENESSSSEINVENKKFIDLKKELCANLQINNKSSVTIFQNNGTINAEVGEAIKQQQQQQQQQAATKIQAGVRGLQSRFDRKAPNNYGFKSFEYQGRLGERKYLVSPNKAYFTTPNISIANASHENGLSGTFKKVSGADKRSVILSSTDIINIQNNKFTSFEVEEILLRNKIPNTVSHKINPNHFVARNAGKLNLASYLSTGEKCTIVNLKNILQHVKSLHMDGYYHLDIKPENIQVKITQDNEPRLSLIDYDTLSSTEKLANLSGTPGYTTMPLHEKLFPGFYQKIKLGNVDQNTLQAYDEYALAMTLMEVEGKSSNSSEVYNSGTNGISLNPQTNQYIEENIKPEYSARFKALITNPISYSQTYLAKEQTKVYLADMCK